MKSSMGLHAVADAPPRRAALVFFGGMPRWHHKSITTSSDVCALDAGLTDLAEHVLPLLRKYVVQPATSTQGFDALHVYGHTWQSSAACQVASRLTRVLHTAIGDVHGVHIAPVLATPFPRGLPADYVSSRHQSWQNTSDVLLRQMAYMHALVSIKWALRLASGAAWTAGAEEGRLRWWEAPLSTV